MHYTELARSLADQYDVPITSVRTSLEAVLKWHGWRGELDAGEVEFIRASVATWGDELKPC